MALSRQLRLLRWLVPPLIFLLAAFHQAAAQRLAAYLDVSWQGYSELLLFGLTGSLVTWLGLSWLAAAGHRSAEAEARLRTAYAELEANHQKLLALHELGHRLATADDETTVLELAARAPLQLTDAQASSVVTFDPEGNRLKLEMAWGLSERYLQALRTYLDQGVDAERCRTCVALKTHVSADCPLFVGIRAVAQAEGIGSLACLPLVRDRERVGIISAYFPAADGPPEEQVRLLNILGGAIAAMLESMRARARQVHTLHALDRATASALGDTLGEFAARMLDIVMAGWEAQAGGVFLYEEETNTWSCRAARGLGQDLEHPAYRLAVQLIRQAREHGGPVIADESEGHEEHRLLSAIATPLLNEGRTVGALFLGARRRQAFHERQFELLRTVAHQAALAIGYARLYERLEQMSILEERYRLAREIHDGLAQTLGYLNLQVERLEMLLSAGRTQAARQEVVELRRTVRAAYVDVREAIDGLRLSVERPEHLAARLRDYVQEFGLQTGIAVEFDAQPSDLVVEAAVGLQLLRIAQEALTNVRKHAQASRVRVALFRSERELELTITDNGMGFPLAPSSSGHRSYGLNGMRERAQSLGGTMTIASGPGQGTRVIVTIPLEGRP
ncbi:MAG: GAF domain-containing protein [Caldilineales bacterium]|nr:GAF domain-containing protein [Caldilineales bacterium]